MPNQQDLHLLIEQAVAGEPVAVRALVDRLSPVIAKRVAATLWRAGNRRHPGVSVSQDAGDMLQDVFLALFQNQGKALRAWDPERGMSLDSFVGLLAQHQVISILRSGKTAPWREDLTEDETLDRIGAPTATPEAVVSSQEDLRTLLERVRATLSPRGLELFQRMIVDEEPLAELEIATGMTRDALYQWKSRLHRTVRSLAAEIDAGSVSETSTELRMVKGVPPT